MSTNIDDVGRIFAETLDISGFGQKTSPLIIATLHKFYETVLKWNESLHLTTIVDPKAFARRHICEAFEVESRIVSDADELWDIGSGLGIPGIPIAIVRPEISVVLVESARKKSIYLEETARELALVNVRVVNRRFDPQIVPEGAVLTARAVEKMTSLIESFLTTSARQILVLGSADLFSSSQLPDWQLSRTLVPGSQSSFLFDLRRNVPRGT
jgi:16S rRNA (guanine527-N7)-methyltransferase